MNEWLERHSGDVRFQRSGSRALVTYDLVVRQKPGYLHLVATGQNNTRNVSACLQQVVQECGATQCFRILNRGAPGGAARSTSSLSPPRSASSQSFKGILQLMGYVDANATGDNMEFAQTVCQNREGEVRVFSSLAPAEAWTVAECERRDKASGDETS